MKLSNESGATAPLNGSPVPPPRRFLRLTDVPGLLAAVGFVAFLPQVIGLPGEAYLWVVVLAAAFSLALAFRPRTGSSLWQRLLRPGPLAAVATLLCIGLAYLPVVRRPLARHDHRQCATLADCRGPLKIGREAQLYDDDYAPYLLSDPGVLDAKIQAFRKVVSVPPGEAPAWDYGSLRNDCALLWAALRVQGRTDREILDLPEGRTLLLGVLVAEGMQPFWWDGKTWPVTVARARPDGAFRLGLVDRELARTAVADLAARLPTLRIEDLAGLVRIAGLHPRLLAPDAANAILAAWRDVQPEPAEREGLRAVLAAREMLRRLAEWKARDGILGLEFVFPAGFPAGARAAVEEAFARHFATLGMRTVSGPGLRIRIAVERRPFEDVFQADEQRETHTETEKVQSTDWDRRLDRLKTTTGTRSRVVSEVHRSNRRGAASVPVLVVSVESPGADAPTGAEAAPTVIVLPPIAPVNVRDQDLVSDDSLSELMRHLERGRIDNDSEAFTVEYATRFHLVRPWEFGLRHDFASEDGFRDMCSR